MQLNISKTHSSLPVNWCFFILLVVLLNSCAVPPRLSEKKLTYLHLTPVSYSTTVPKRHIDLIEADKVRFETSGLEQLDDREMVSQLKYTRQQRIAVLKEYLTFRGDTTWSDKQYNFSFGLTVNRLKMANEHIRISVEVEALYAVTAMLFPANVRISPILLNTTDNSVCNTNENDIKEIYNIYIKWEAEMEKQNFKILTWPLAGTKYQWAGYHERIPLRSEL